MNPTSINCAEISGEFKTLVKEIDRWTREQQTKNYWADPKSAAVKMVNAQFGMPLEALMSPTYGLTEGEVSLFKTRLKDLNSMVESGDIASHFAKMFWQPSHYKKKHPILYDFLSNVQESAFHFKRHYIGDRMSFTSMMESMKNEAVSRSLMSGGWGGKLRRIFSRKDAQKEIAELDHDYKAAWVEFEQTGSKESMDTALGKKGQIDRLISNSYLKVYDDLRRVVEEELPRVMKNKFDGLSKKEKDKLLKYKKSLRLSKEDLINLKLPDDNGNFTLPMTTDMSNALVKYNDLMNSLYKRLRHGVEARIDAKLIKTSLREGESARLSGLKERLRAKLMPKYETGFFPHYVRELQVDFMDKLMPHFDDLQSHGMSKYLKKESKSIDDIISTIDKIIEDTPDIIPGTTKSRIGQYEYSKDFYNVINNYIEDVNRFNFIAFTDKHLLSSVQGLETMFKKGNGIAEKHAESVANYLQDLHMAAHGDNKLSENTRNMMRVLLGFEFISKLGINPRGAARNFTQRALDYVEWGPIQVHRANKSIANYLKKVTKRGDEEATVDGFIEEELKKIGILFEEGAPQLEEIAVQSPANLFKFLSFNEKLGKYEYIKPGNLGKAANMVGKTAGWAAVMHRKVENSNRKHTFKIAFGQMLYWLNNPNFDRYQREMNPNVRQSNIERKRLAIARKFAINAVIMNHFDYSDFAKSKLLRHPVGKFLGQFQHFSFEFAQRNIDIMEEAKHDLLSGKFLPRNDAKGLQKAYRMGMIYFMAPILASMATGVDFSNLLQHDTAQRLGQLKAAMVGDEDEIAQAFYGKGPIIATFGGPLISDILDVGVMLDVINANDNELLSLLKAFDENYSKQYADGGKTAQKIRLLNTFLGRFTSRHLPQIAEGRIGWALQQELGLYPTAKARKTQRAAAKARKKIMPQDLELLMRQIQAGQLP